MMIEGGEVAGVLHQFFNSIRATGDHEISGGYQGNYRELAA